MIQNKQEGLRKNEIMQESQLFPLSRDETVLASYSDLTIQDESASHTMNFERNWNLQ